jgi:TonB family protein
MSGKQKEKSPPWILVAVMIVLASGGVYIVKTVLSEDAPRRKNTTATVTLLKPPPPVIKERPPEPEIKEVPKQEEIIDPGLKNEAETPQNDSQDSTPAGDTLGVDAEAGAGSDGFGLVGKKGGRSLLAGGSGKVSLLTKFVGYTQIVTTEIRKKVMKRLDEEGGIPKGKLQVVIRVSVDAEGKIIDHRIIGSSGNNRMDEAIIDSLRSFRISEPPPESMPRTMNIKIISQG